MSIRSEEQAAKDAEKAADRYWSFVDIREENECWPWLGLKSKRGKGEGQYRVGGVRVSARDMAYQLVFGEIPPTGAPLYCGNVECVNPKHMEAPLVREHKDPPPVICGIDGCSRRIAGQGMCRPHLTHFSKKFG